MNLAIPAEIIAPSLGAAVGILIFAACMVAVVAAGLRR